MKRLMNWFRRRNLESDLDRELKYHMDRRVRPDAVRACRNGSSKAGHSGAWRLRTGPGRSARRLADPMAAGLPYDLRFSARSFLVVRRLRDGSAFARARDRSNHGHLLSSRSSRPARASGTRPRTPCSYRLEGRSGEHQRIRQLQPDVVPDLPRSSTAETDFSKACSAGPLRP